MQQQKTVLIQQQADVTEAGTRVQTSEQEERVHVASIAVRLIATADNGTIIDHMASANHVRTLARNTAVLQSGAVK